MKIIVSLSGGRDSATCLGLAVDKYGAENVYAMGFEYGSTHPQELDCAKKIAAYYGVPYQIVKIEPSIFSGSSCTMLQGHSKPIEKGKTYEQILAEKEGKVDTYVPFRNGLFSAYVAAKAESLVQQFNDDVIIMLGQHADDSGYSVDENGVEHLDDSKAAYPDAVAKGTKILMSNYTYKNIEDIQVGDEILSVDENSLKLRKAKVLNKTYAGNKLVYNPIDTLLVSENHLMFRPNFKTKVKPYSCLNRKNASYHAYKYDMRFGVIENLDEYNLGYLRGFYDGDGWLTYISKTNHRIYFCQKEKAILEEIIKLLDKYDLLDNRDIKIYSRQSELNHIYNFGLHSTEATDKFFNLTKYSNSKSYCQGYLAGMIIAEGTITKAKDKAVIISLCQSISHNPEIVDEINTCFNILNFTPCSWKDKSDCLNWSFSKAYLFPLIYGAHKKQKFDKLRDDVSISKSCNLLSIASFDKNNSVKKEECWDLTTESGTFFADNILVHNCSVNFVKAFENVVKISSVGRVHYEAPFVKNHKWELIKCGLELEKPVPYELCLSCYDPIVHEDGSFEECIFTEKPCATCLDVKKAMKEALMNVPDTLLSTIKDKRPSLYEYLIKFINY